MKIRVFEDDPLTGASVPVGDKLIWECFCGWELGVRRRRECPVERISCSNCGFTFDINFERGTSTGWYEATR